MKVKIKKLHEEAVIPAYQSAGAAGFDFHALGDVYIDPGDTVIVRTGLGMVIPNGYELQIRPRSGMSAKTKIRVGNAPGTIDSDFRGEIKIILDNIGTFPVTIKSGERIAQGVLAEVGQAEFEIVNELDETARGSNGFGSSGK